MMIPYDYEKLVTMTVPELIWASSGYEQEIRIWQDKIQVAERQVAAEQANRDVIRKMTNEEVVERAGAEYERLVHNYVDKTNQAHSLKPLVAALDAWACGNHRLYSKAYSCAIANLQVFSHSLPMPQLPSPEEWRKKQLELVNMRLYYAEIHLLHCQDQLQKNLDEAWELNKVCPKPGGYNLPEPIVAFVAYDLVGFNKV